MKFFLKFISLNLILLSVLLTLNGQNPSSFKVENETSLILQSEVGKTYFLQETNDLINWNSLPGVIIGSGAAEQSSLFSALEDQSKFYRFLITDTNTQNPLDTDGDGMGDEDELFLKIDPLMINSVSDLATVGVDSRLVGRIPVNGLSIFNDYQSNGVNLIFERNQHCWVNDIKNISCMSPWNSLSGRNRAGIAITPRHVIFSAHYGFTASPQTKIYFVDDTNNVIERTVIRRKFHPNYNSPNLYSNDLIVGVLDRDLPSSIKLVDFFPDNWSEYLEEGRRIPSLRLNQHEEALVGDFWTNSLEGSRVYHLEPTDPKRSEFYLSLAAPDEEGLYGGDTGNGGFLVINSALVLTTVWTYGGAGSGTSVTREKGVINTMISELDREVDSITGYQISEIDLSDFYKTADIPLESAQ